MKKRAAVVVPALIFLGCAGWCFFAGTRSDEGLVYDWDLVLEAALLMWIPAVISLAVLVCNIRTRVRRERSFRELDEALFRAEQEAENDQNDR